MLNPSSPPVFAEAEIVQEDRGTFPEDDVRQIGGRMRRAVFFLSLVMITLIVTPVFSKVELEVRSKAPDFTLAVAGADSSITLSDFVDKKIVIVHFWKSK